MVDIKFKGRKMLCVCLNCGHYQPGWERVDGVGCEVCGGYLKPLGWWDEYPKKVLNELLFHIPDINDELVAFIKKAK